MVHAFVNLAGVGSSAEFRLGMRQLAGMLPSVRWIVGNSPSFEAFWRQSRDLAPRLDGQVLLLHTPLVFLGRDCLEKLLAGLADSGAPAVLPVDPRTWQGEGLLDYATLRGFDGFVERLARPGRRLLPYDGHSPLLQLVPASRLRQAAKRHEEWDSVLAPPAEALLVSDAFVHPYADYYGNNRAEVLELVPHGTARLLDVGGGEGGFAALARERLACEAHVAELNPDAAAKAAMVVDRVWQGDFLELPIEARFDCITMLDVLEHATDPGAMLCRASELLTPAGVIVAAIPNLGHWSVVLDLLEGRWDYVPAGIACWTHLRFFTRRTMEQFFRLSGLCVERVVTVPMPAPPEVREALDRGGEGPFLPDWESLDAYAYHLVARRAV